ncbi:hypothetical protein [Marmoricola sp. OAE513]|uniref:hypothetical protein n=1 Tax=Marmoricola sp. OAE513 TaxID=2817894 RepID=UPI00339A5A7F
MDARAEHDRVMEKYAAMKGRDYVLVLLGYLSALAVAWWVTGQAAVVGDALVGGGVVAVLMVASELRKLRLRRNAADFLAHGQP